MTTRSLKFVCGTRTLDISSGRYKVATDFVPPAQSLTPQFAEGTSANRRGGASLVGTKANNRSWSFGIHVSGGSEAEVRRAIADIQTFLNYASADAANPLYLEYRPDADVPDPLWGQGSLRRYEVVFGTATIGPAYGLQPLYVKAVPNCTIAVTVKPFAVGTKQRLASATGGIVEDTVGVSDGLSRGLSIPSATTNAFTNPIFGHATWNNGWSATATASQNTDATYIVYGTSSAKVLGSGVFYQALTLTVATYTLSFYARRVDGAAITSSDCQAYFNNSVQTSTYTSVGNGWYRVTYTGTASATPANYGVSAAANRTVYVDGFQVENVGFATPLAHGDALGCAWTGTAHASTSTRTAARARIPIDATTWNNAEYTIVCVWKTPAANTSLATVYLWDFGSTFHLRFDTTNDEFVYRDGTNQVTSAAQTFALGDVLVMHATAKPGTGLVLYKNGSSIGTNATYTPAAPASYLYVGSTSAAASHAMGTFMGFAIFPRALTSTEASNHYGNISQLVADGQYTNTVPWLWTKDGDDVVDNCDDSTRDNWCVCGGIPGSDESDTRWEITPSAVDKTGYWLMRVDVEYADFRYPNSGTAAGVWYGERQETADANASGGEYDSVSVSVTPDFASFTVSPARLMIGEVHFFVRMKDSASSRTVTFRPWYQNAAGERVFAQQSAQGDIDTSYRWFYCGSMATNQPASIDRSKWQLTLGLQASIPSGSFTAHVDYMMAINSQAILRLDDTPSGSTSWSKIVVGSGESNVVDSSDLLYSSLPDRGSLYPHLLPGRANVVWFVLGGHGDTHTITQTGTFTRVDVTPRWGLL